MAARGPLPKDAAKRQRRNKTLATTTLKAPPKTTPALPGTGYLKATREWYAVWRKSPQASQFTATDWQRLHMLAALVDQFFRAPEKGLFSEIRMTEANLGATVADRQRLHWEIAPDGEEEKAAPKPRAPKKRTDPRLRLVS